MLIVALSLTVVFLVFFYYWLQQVFRDWYSRDNLIVKNSVFSLSPLAELMLIINFKLLKYFVLIVNTFLIKLYDSLLCFLSIPTWITFFYWLTGTQCIEKTLNSSASCLSTLFI